ncbi:ADP-ribosylglycohydrolase [Micromonospora sp. Llam0]|uniref:ADP-ribosylglycohydrolase family protein n=1 Tax=Micromonospora sp. Llam0 TaxID=2485143 RepID=UPI000F484A02|nr:ADP-ribosylglycohydrolase family protein [Micromonospora sp. Llam0]ROO63134.1 ADP-ribosylglycohydrolase [Micromonospora sp. Llam0]
MDISSGGPSPYQTDPDDWARRVRGSLLMAACADALGASGATRPARPDEPYRPPMRFGITTARSLALTHHLVGHRGTVDEPTFPADVSVVPELAVPSPDRRDDLVTAAAPPAWIAPIGLLPDLGHSAVADLARRAAAAATDDGALVAAAAVQAVAVALAARSPAMVRLRPAAFVQTLRQHAGHPGCAEIVRMAARAARHDPLVDALSEQFSDADPALTATGIAVAVFLTHHDDPVAAIAAALLAPATGDVAAVMAAAMCGASLGERRTPARWGSRLQSSWLIWTAANRLATLSRAAPGPGER